MDTFEKTRLKITQLEVHFIKVNELKLTQVELIIFFSIYVCCYKCIRVVLYCPFSKYWIVFVPFSPFILGTKFYVLANSPAWADENQLNNKKVRFLSEMNEVNSRWVRFNLYEWTLFKIVNKHLYAQIHFICTNNIVLHIRN